ncbi:MAG: anhydro-N-acetylmuramic acid kinase [Bacteroidota bacterium]
MKKLQQLQRKKTKLVIGLISGTSADGIDAALVKFRGNGTATRLRLLAFDTYSYPKGLRELILENSLPGTGSVDLLCRLNILCGHFFADAVKKIARRARVPLSMIDLVGSHGQTVHHLPKPESMFGKKVRATLQIGDPSTIAQLTGIPTVGDFRTADMAVGGQGAPLASYFDYVLCRSKSKNRILLNLGGIANFTMLPRNCRADQVLAFDTGPASMVIDALMMRFFKKKYDEGGRVARSGNVQPMLLARLLSHPYLKQTPPKSTGREEFGEMFVKSLLKHARGVSRTDLIATVTELTAASVFDQYRRFIKKKMRVDEVLASGGGVHNRAIMAGLRRYFEPAEVKRIEDIGVSSDGKEAALFALLANETVAEIPSNIPSVSGAQKSVILGKICLP